MRRLSSIPRKKSSNPRRPLVQPFSYQSEEKRSIDLARQVVILTLLLLAVAIRAHAGDATIAQTKQRSGVIAGQARPEAATRKPDVVYIPSPQEVVNAMLKLAKVTRRDVVYDLGSGDGRIVITAATRCGARGVGVDIDPQRVRESSANVRAANLDGRVTIVQGDLFETDIRKATVVTLYLSQALNQKLRPKLLAELRPRARVVSYHFDMGDWEPEQVVRVGDGTIYLWRVPEKKE